MAVTIAATNHTEIDDCDAETYWVGNAIDSDTNLKKEGTQSLCFILKTNGLNVVTCTPAASIDMSGTKHMRLWFLSTVSAQLDTMANGGIQFWVSDGVNTGYYYVAGSDTYEGGWINLVIDLSKTVDIGTKPTSMNAITTCGIRTKMTSMGKQALNTWIDYFHLADGLSCYGDDAGSYFDFDDIITAEETGGWGILRKIGGQFFATGEFVIGDGSGTNGCKFQAKSQVMVFEDRKVNTALYGFDVVDNGTGVTEFILGAKSGTAGIQGCVIRVESTSQSAKFYLDAKTDTDVDNSKLYASTFYGAGDIKFSKADASNAEVLGCSFEACAQVDSFTCKTEGCFFINTSDADSAILWNESIDITDCSFIGNTTGAGIEMPSAVGTPYTYDGLLFSGNTYDVLNSSGSAITVNKTNGSDPSTYEGTLVTFSASFNHIITGLELNTEVTYVTAGTSIELYHVENASVSDGDGKYKTTYSHGGGASVDILIFHTDYKPDISNIIGITLPNAEATVKVQMFADENYYNPA